MTEGKTLLSATCGDSAETNSDAERPLYPHMVMTVRSEFSVRSRRGGKDNRQSGRQPYRRHEIHQGASRDFSKSIPVTRPPAWR